MGKNQEAVRCEEEGGGTAASVFNADLVWFQGQDDAVGSADEEVHCGEEAG